MTWRAVVAGRYGYSPGFDTSPFTYIGLYSATIVVTSSGFITTTISRPSVVCCRNTLLASATRIWARICDKGRPATGTTPTSGNEMFPSIWTAARYRSSGTPAAATSSTSPTFTRYSAFACVPEIVRPTATTPHLTKQQRLLPKTLIWKQLRKVEFGIAATLCTDVVTKVKSFKSVRGHQHVNI